MNDISIQESSKLEEQGQSTPSLFKQHNFIFLWIASAFSSISISMFLFSQSWYVVDRLGLEASIGLIFIASSVPRLLFMAVGGVLADRMSRSLIMFISDITRAILLVGVVLLVLLDAVTLWSFVGLALIFGILDAFFWPASSSLIPTIVKKDTITRANSVIQMTNQFCTIFGPMVAGFLIVWGGYAFSFGVVAALLFMASICVYMIKLKKKDSVEEGTASTGMLQSIKEGLSYVKKSSFLSTLLMLTLFLNLFIAGPLVMGLPLFVKNVLGGETLEYSYLEGAIAGGMLIGSIIIGILNVRKKRGKIAIIGIGFTALFYLALSLSPFFWLSFIFVLFIGLTMSIVNLPLISVVQSLISQEMLGRVMSLLSMSSMGLIPISYAITSILLAAGVSINTIMTFGALPLLIAIPIVYWKVPDIRTVD
ncbi:MFS transporter [Bacillus horti]|uniref:MFS family permease n=1 Tax=Caldalkalibacillus horti TaxID=77523 RepID=A0ABT9VU26_9BACI|nr:MFS transporter [Bacillus horti]MDQ0164491.1 MFS family permease [Bacillus horti]